MSRSHGTRRARRRGAPNPSAEPKDGTAARSATPTSGATRPESGPISPGEEYERARQICLSQLSQSARTRAQLAAALSRRGVDETVAADLLGRLETVGLIDDESFAAAWVDSRHRGRGIGPRKIAHELRTRGIAPDLAASSLDTITPDEQRATAMTVIERRLVATRGKPSHVRARHLIGILARKGYPPAIAHDVVREALAAEGAELPEPADPIDLVDPAEV